VTSEITKNNQIADAHQMPWVRSYNRSFYTYGEAKNVLEDMFFGDP
jgi:hypothetical protein